MHKYQARRSSYYLLELDYPSQIEEPGNIHVLVDMTEYLCEHLVVKQLFKFIFFEGRLWARSSCSL
jgi:hypothetical protein